MAQRSERHELDLRVASEKAKAAKKIGAKK
jgi:hypothetical protein